jgi:protease-4
MKSFWLRFFAVVGVLASIAFLLVVYSCWHMSRHAENPVVPDSVVLSINLDKPIVEQSNASPLRALLDDSPDDVSLLEVVGALNRAKDDPRVKAVVVRFGMEDLSLAHAQEIREAVRKLNKPTYAFATSFGAFGGGNKSYYIASAFREIWLQPVGTVGLTEIGFEVPFGKTALENFGVSSDFLQREEYKSAMESFSRDAFSAPAKEDIEKMLKTVQEQLAMGIAENKTWEVAKVRDLMSRGPYTATEAVQHELVTRLGYEDEVFDAVKKEVGDSAKKIDIYDYLAASEPSHDPKTAVAMIYVGGLISDASMGPRDLIEDRVSDAETIAKAFRDAAKDPKIKAILLRVNSPGGTPSGAETIRHALIRAKDSGKPIFVSMGEMAASGGYWVAMDADHIVAEPATLTGSIGVVSGKFVLGGLWQKLGVKWERMETGENAHLSSNLDAYSPFARERMNALMDETYQVFLSNVSAARKIPIDKMPDLAKGRVFTGDEALKLGLVDELGGMQTTIVALKKQLKMEPNDPVSIREFPAPKTPFDDLLRFFKNADGMSASLGSLSSLWQAVGPKLGVAEGMRGSPIRARMPMAFEVP